MPGFLIEIKVLRNAQEKDGIEEQLKLLAKETLDQINSKKYDVMMQAEGVKQIVKFGIAFYKKQVEICAEG